MGRGVYWTVGGNDIVKGQLEAEEVETKRVW